MHIDQFLMEHKKKEKNWRQMSFQFHPHAIKFTIYKKKKNLVIVHICSYAAKREWIVCPTTQLPTKNRWRRTEMTRVCVPLIHTRAHYTTGYVKAVFVCSGSVFFLWCFPTEREAWCLVGRNCSERVVCVLRVPLISPSGFERV